MKKCWFICLLLCTGLLSACSAEKTISGEVVEVNTNTESDIESLVIRTEDNKDIGIIMEQNSYMVPWFDEFDEDAFKTGEQSGILVSASCKRNRSSMMTQTGTTVTAFPATRVSVNGMITRNALSLSDDTPIDVVKQHMFGTKYQLSDGTELLWEHTSSGPDNVYVGGIESFDDLSEAAKDRVLSFYTDRGLLYSVQDELENAYAAFLENGADKKFNSYHVGQDISPSASSDRLMYFRTVVTYPIDEQLITEKHLGAAFDRETGEHIDNLDLFTCSEQEILPNLLNIAGVTEPDLRKEMKAAFTPENIVFSPSGIELNFHQGTLPSQEHSYFVAVDYAERLCEILHDWAIPYADETE